MASEIKVDTISEKTSANGVSIDSFQVKDGGILAATGTILQVVTLINPITTENIISNTSFTNITFDGSNKLEIKITPKQSDSKIISISQAQTYHEKAAEVAFIRAVRDISGGTTGTTVQTYRFRDENTPNNYNTNYPFSYTFVDTPNTTSEVTYYFQGKTDSTASEIGWTTYSANNRGQTFILMEIGV
jgi:hypothetical protein